MAADPAASVYQTPEWTDAICSAGGYTDVSRLYELPDGRTAVLPLVRRVQALTRLATEASPPAYWGTGGLVSADGVRPEDTTIAWADLLAQRAARIRVRPGYRGIGPWRRTPPRGAVTSPQSVHVLSLEGGFEEVWEHRFASSTRRAVRKAEKAGLEVECDTTGRLVVVCHDLYLGWLRARARHRSIPFFLVRRRNALEDSLRKYKAVAATLGSACRTFVARRDGRAVAAAIILVWGDEAIYWRGYGDPELAHPTRANNLIQRAAIEEACSVGCATYNMGESGGVASLMEFKKRHGAEPREFAEFTLERFLLALIGSLRATVEQRLVRLAGAEP